MTKDKYEVFIKGETVDLVIPNKNAIETDQWNSWFNDKEKMQFLPEHAMFPNTKKDQYLRLNKKLIRPSKTVSLTGDTNKAKKTFNFKIKTDLDKLISIMMNNDLEIELNGR